MTKEEFDKTRWGAGMIGLYGGVEYTIIAVDFTEHLVGLADEPDEESASWCNWVRCESVEIKK